MTEYNDQALKGRRMNLADYEFSRFGVRVPAGTTVDDLISPTYLRNYAHMLKPGAEVIILSDDFALDVSLRVMSVTKTTTHCRVIRDSSIDIAPVAEAPTYDLPGSIVVNWGGPKHRHRFLHNGEVVAHGFGSRNEAAEAAAAYVLKEKVA